MPITAKPDFIILGDLHVGDLHPECRTDDYKEALKRKLNWIQDKYGNIPKLQPGDVFDHWKQTPEMITFALMNLPVPFYATWGQHDLPNHQFDLAYKSAWMTCNAAGVIQPWKCARAWGTELGPAPTNGKDRKIALIHVSTWVVPYNPKDAPNDALRLLKANPGWDIIVTGDNHQTFVVDYEGQLLVNAGSLMRMRADQVDHKPCIFEYYASTNTVKQVFVPIEDVVNRTKVDAVHAREDRVSAFVERLGSGSMEVGMTFEDNMKTKLADGTVPEQVASIVRECME
jgi:hypothetical protein